MPKNYCAENLQGRPAIVKGFAVMLVALAFVAGSASSNPALAQQQRRSQNASNRSAQGRSAIPEETLLRIVRAEDERRWSDALGLLLSDKSARVRSRAALAAGRIGDERAVSSLAALLETDREGSVRAMAAFALGEMEAASGADALLAALSRAAEPFEVRANVVEALGKIAAALPKTDEARLAALGEALLGALNVEAARVTQEASNKTRANNRAQGNRKIILAGLTAALRAHPANAALTVARFLSHRDARIRADAANTLARLRTGDANQEVRPHLTNDAEAIVRANAARVLGASEDKASLDALVARAVGDGDERVRVSSIRALALLKDARAAAPLLGHAATLFASYSAAKAGGVAHPREAGEMLEIAVALGQLLANTGDQRALGWLKEFRAAESMRAPEIEAAFAHIAPAAYLREEPFDKISDEATRARLRADWRVVSSIAQGLGEIGGIKAAVAGSGVVRLQGDAQIILRGLLEDASMPATPVPDLLRAFDAFKTTDAAEVFRKQLDARDVIVRATAAELLGGLRPDEASARALILALPTAMRDDMNDAALSILEALGKQKSAAGNEAIKTALDSTDHLVRRRAVALLKANDAGDFSSRVGFVATRNTITDYRRAVARRQGRWRATVSTDKGSFVIELLPEDAPLTVDNFVQLARRGYFNNVAFHRVVPNFVIQGGDPRGGGNGGPGYQIRCEINEVEYERGAVGMALSGKDTGGSQWFVTHSPQPHLDGGYTVFGRVVSGLDVVDAIERGDRIRNITVAEGASPTQKSASKAGRKPRR